MPDAVDAEEESAFASVVDRGDHIHCILAEGWTLRYLDLVLDRVVALEQGRPPPVRVLVDMRAVRTLPPGIVMLFVKRRADFARRRIAIVGQPGAMSAIFIPLQKAVGHQNSRYFVSMDEALAWLPGG